MPVSHRLRRWTVPALLVFCVVVVGFWEIMARRSAAPFRPFDLTAEDFAGFHPRWDGWSVRLVPVSTNDPAEPNIVALAVERADRAYLVRLVHGYNMPMCMKVKGYEATEIGDRRPETIDHRPETAESRTGRAAGDPPDATRGYGPESMVHGPRSKVSTQSWRLTSSIGDCTLWATTMLSAGDMAATEVRTDSMKFPRVDGAEDPNWVPRGVTWGSLRHPVAGLRRYLRSRWNSSRRDLLTFLRWRQPAWASEELLTFVSRTVEPPVTAATEAARLAELEAVHVRLQADLAAWWGQAQENSDRRP